MDRRRVMAALGGLAAALVGGNARPDDGPEWAESPDLVRLTRRGGQVQTEYLGVVADVHHARQRAGLEPGEYRLLGTDGKVVGFFFVAAGGTTLPA